MGICLLTLINMSHPLDNINNIDIELLNKIKNNTLFTFNINNNKYSIELINLIKRMLI